MTHLAKIQAMVFTSYVVRDVDGNTVAVKKRHDLEGGRKTFTWHGPDGASKLEGMRVNELPFYGSEHIKSWDVGVSLVIAEGEKAADALRAHGFQGLGTVTGATGCPVTPVLETLRGRIIVLWPDNDDPGHAHMRRIARKLDDLGIAVSVVDTSSLPAKADSADVNATTARRLVAAAQPYVPPAEAPTSARMVSIDSLGGDYGGAMDHIEAKKGTGRVSLRWGFNQLDVLTDGLRPGLICFHAAPGAGKTAFALSVAAKVNAPTLFVSAEMALLELMRRLIAQTTNTPKRELLRGSLDPAEEAHLLEQTKAVTRHLNFVESTSEPIGADWIRSRMRELKAQDPDGHALLVIDSLHSWIVPYMGVHHPEHNEYASINIGVAELRIIANKLDVPVVMICERNRAMMKEGGLSAVAGSRAPEYRSDTVIDMSMSKNEEADDHDTKREIMLKIVKNRWGPPGAEVGFEFDGELQQFTEVYGS